MTTSHPAGVESIERVVAMLLGLRRAAAMRMRQPAPPIMPNQHLAAALAAVFSDSALSQAIAMLANAAEDRVNVATTLPDLMQTAQRIWAQFRTHPQLAPRTRVFHDTITTICAIDSLTFSNAERCADLRLESAEFFSYIHEIFVKTDEYQPDVIISGIDPNGTTKIDLKGNSYVERRVQISYSGNQTYPRLCLRTPTKSSIEARPQERPYWIQKAISAYDLEIFTHQNRFKGSVRTSFEDWPLDVKGVHFNLYIPEINGMRLVATDIADEQGRKIVRCIRIAPRPNAV